MDTRARTSKAAKLLENPEEGASGGEIAPLLPKEGAIVTPDWLLTFLSRQEERDIKREHLANERESLREERHETSMDGRMRVSARDEQIVNSEDTTTGPGTRNTGRSNVQIVNSRDTPTVQDDRRSCDATHAKARPPEQNVY